MIPSSITFFASAARSSSEEIERQSAYFRHSELIGKLFDAMQNIVMILNENRQLVYANKRLSDFTGIDNSLFLGSRPGELFECPNSRCTGGGCGTSEACATCGAVLAILAGLKGDFDIRECRMKRKRSDGQSLESLELRVSASPFDYNGERFVIFVINDISHEKRRRILEKVFFHDVLNTAGSIRGFIGLFRDDECECTKDDFNTVSELVDHLIEEIKAQKELAAAESNELTVNPNPFQSFEILEIMQVMYTGTDIGRNKNVNIYDQAENVELFTDYSLLKRILGNMLKNALEASNEGDTITIGSKSEDGGNCLFRVNNPAYIPRDIQLQIFYRSFSTKGKDRGLGTYSIKLLTEKYLKGKAYFTSSMEEGTTFYVSIPTNLEEHN